MGRKEIGGGDKSKVNERTDVAPVGLSPHDRQSLGRLELQVEYLPLSSLVGYQRNAKKHPKKQLKLLEKGIQEFGFVVPILVDENNTVIAGHARCFVANQIGLDRVPALTLTHLTSSQVKALRIADNRLVELGDWDRDLLAIELADLVEIDFDVELTGFEAPEVDLLFDTQLDNRGEQEADALPLVDGDITPVSRLGDLWRLGDHFLFCGDARAEEAYRILMRGQEAQLVFTDPPYNVPIDGHATGAGNVHHSEFVMASGDMTPMEFAEFLDQTIHQLTQHSLDGALHYLCMDWRSLYLLQSVCSDHYARQVNLCVWAKSNGGMGSFYRSQHELVVVYQYGTSPHTNNIQLGKYSRNRTNVWSYAGVNSLDPERRDELKLHPTVKPCDMIADAILDASNRNGLVLDPFVGSGTTIIACEKTGRQCRAMELDPKYVDVAIKRWQDYTGHDAIHAFNGRTFSDHIARRSDGDGGVSGPTEVVC